MYLYLVIDDEEIIRKGTIAKLKGMSDCVACAGEAADGKEALHMIETLSPDIIITDMNMPNMDGSSLLPILARRYPEKPIIVISGYKDFEYTRHAIQAKAIDYLLKPFGKEELQASIANAIAFLNNRESLRHQLVDHEMEKENACYEYDIQSLMNSILGYHTEKISLSSQKLSYMNNTHKLILMTLHTRDCFDEQEIQNYLDENGFGDLALYLQHINNRHLGFLILFTPEQATLIVKSILNFFELSDLPVSIGISSMHDGLTKLYDAFLETVHALNRKKVKEENQFYFYEETQDPHYSLCWEHQEELLFRIEAGMPEAVQTLIHELFQYLGNLAESSYSDIKYYCFQLTDSTRVMLSSYIEQLHQTSVASSTQNILNTMFDLDELETYYLQFFTNIAGILFENSIYASNDVIEKVKLYTQKYYYKDLTVELLSCFFYMSRSYLSHLFKKRTGENFVDYLNDIRIEKSKELLENSDKKMYQIAKQVGYDNVKYFFRIFKKKAGVTPEKWRNTH